MAEHNPKQADMVRRAINAETTSELEELYDDWATTYDDYVGGLSYVAPPFAARLLAEHLSNKDSAILDVGCGTGLVGIELAQLGYSIIDGIDLSEGMLVIAKETDHYQNLAQADINLPFEQEPDQFDASISVGILGIHVTTNALDEMIRVTKSGGVISISIRNPYYEPSGYKAHIKSLVEQGVIKLLVESEKAYILDEGATAMYLVMGVV